MARVLGNLLGKPEQPEVLDLGQSCGSTAVYLASRGAKVRVENFKPPGSPSIELSHPDERFDLVLAWEHWDFVPPDRVAEFAAEVGRVLVPGGWLLLFAEDRMSSDETRSGRAGSYRITADDRMIRLPGQGPARSRWGHPNRAIERALAPLAIESIHLQRNRMREFLVRKPRAAS
jgi:SAM-dependent methyltransferase